ncbi:MAG: PilZ domain-containing protein, partial [Spirochaetales bacterium]|nr:PilZ domain-containing protein [Spirochaetales bacterium]
MKALLVVEDDSVAEIVQYYLQPLGLDVIRYHDPLKALDNLDEILPDAVVMSARDFPRHWKTLVVNLRASRPKSACAIILLKGAYFPFEEAAKAAYLGVNAVIKEDLSDRAEMDRFQQVLKRYVD